MILSAILIISTAVPTAPERIIDPSSKISDVSMIEKISSNNIYVHFKSKFIDSSYY
jgi:hypothetical protein